MAEKRVDFVYYFTRLMPDEIRRFVEVEAGANEYVSVTLPGYDNLGRTLSLLHQGLIEGTMATSIQYANITYDVMNRVTSFYNDYDDISTFKYDATGQIISADHSSTYNPQTYDEAYVYDLNGNRASAVNNDGSKDYSTRSRSLREQ